MEDEIKKLIEGNKLEDAFMLFEKKLRGSAIDPDQGEMQTKAFELFIDATNSINKEESQDLTDVQEVLGSISAKEKSIRNKDETDKIKQELFETPEKN